MLFNMVAQTRQRQPPYYLANKANLVPTFSLYVYFFSLHISRDYVPIIRRNNCIYATLGICHSLWVTVWFAYQMMAT